MALSETDLNLLK